MARRVRKAIPAGLVRISRLAQLSGVPASTIKHYVRVGLLPPPVTRPNKQMAYYDEGLVDRILAIKILQSERFLPLPAILRILGEPPRTGEKRAEAIKAQQLAALEPALTPPPSGWLAREELLGNFQVTARELDVLAQSGLVTTTRTAQDSRAGYADTDLEILRVIHETRAAGLGDLFPMEVLAPYVVQVRELVKLELGLFRARLQSGAHMPEGRSLDEVATLSQRLVERLLVALRRKLLLLELKQIGKDADKPVRKRKR